MLGEVRVADDDRQRQELDSKHLDVSTETLGGCK